MLSDATTYVTQKMTQECLFTYIDNYIGVASSTDVGRQFYQLYALFVDLPMTKNKTNPPMSPHMFGHTN